MYRGAEAEQPSSTEEDWAFQFESAHLITLACSTSRTSASRAAPSRRS